MSTTLTESATVKAARKIELPAWMREPLLHFALLGGLLFGIDQLVASRADDPRVIVIDPQVDADAIRVFKEARGHEPNDEELYALRRVWLDNEVLYREGVALGLDKGDAAIRERVIFKALSMVDANVKRPAVDEATIKAWFEKNRSRYDEPARFDFQEAILLGDKSESAARAFADSLNSGNPGDAQADLRVFTHRPHENIVQSYGEDFARNLETMPANEWRVVVSKDGPRVMRVTASSPAKPASFEDMGGIVLQDWTDSVMAGQRSDAVRALARKYKVKVESRAP